jgi:hypothetical protein
MWWQLVSHPFEAIEATHAWFRSKDTAIPELLLVADNSVGIKLASCCDTALISACG